MLRIIIFFIIAHLQVFSQIVDESSLIAKPKNKIKVTTSNKTSAQKNSSKNTPAATSKAKSSSPNLSNEKTQPPSVAKPTQNKPATTPPLTPAPATLTPSSPSQQPPTATVTKPQEPKTKLTPAIKNESIPPLSDEELNTPVTNSNILTPNLESRSNNNNSPEDLDKPRYKNRKAWTIDYNTWYEMLIIKDKTNSTYGETKSHYFGVGYYYDYTVYEDKFGYAGSLGFIIGNAQAGTMNTGEYYERRITWMGYRAGGRVFVRVNSRIDIGPALIIQYKNTNWPEETDFKVMSQANPQYFMYVDTRWRLNYPLELIQSFGFHARQYALVWRLGLNYTFN